MKVKGFIKDINGIKIIENNRKKALENADGKAIPEDNITKTARLLHPGKQEATLIAKEKVSLSSTKLIFKGDNFPLFKAGNYLTIELNIGTSRLTRSYSISSSPLKAYNEGIVEIIVKNYKDGFVCNYLINELEIGSKVILEIGLGQFNVEKARDAKHLVFIAGGAGITPFLSIIKDVKERNLDYKITVLYGNDNPNDIIAYDELEALKDNNIQIVYIISGNYDFDGKKGFISKEIISEYIKDDATFFICGPKALFNYVNKELESLNIPLRRIRKELYSSINLLDDANYPKEKINDIYNIKVFQGRYVTDIKAFANESIATALERAGLKIHTSCKAGECGSCRLKILKGNYYIPNSYDKRRKADRGFNYVHSCVTFPLSDLEIKINI